MRPSFAGHPVASVLFFCTLAVWTVIEIRQAFHRRGEATNTDRGSLVIVRLCAVAGILLAQFAVAKVTATAFPSGAVILGISLCIVWAGIALRWWGFRTLGHYFTITVMTSADSPVITTGPYRVLRPPR